MDILRVGLFFIKLTGIIIKRALLELFSPESIGAGGRTPPNQNFQSVWMGMALKMAFINSSLRWPVYEVNMDGIRLWSWLKIRCESASKLILERITPRGHA